MKTVQSYPKRVVFPKGEQFRFLEKARTILGLDYSEMAGLLKVHPRTLNDWKREAGSMPLPIVEKIAREGKMKMPVHAKIRDPFWYVKEGAGSKGGATVYKKYGRIGGDPEYRKKKWYEWWEREGKRKYSFIGVCKPIAQPRRSKDLAEFVGIVLGDGGISKRQITFTLHAVDDKPYSKFIISLVKSLFNVPVRNHNHNNSLGVDYVISRSELVRFCTERLGLKVGGKVRQQVDIPLWIKKNKDYATVCVRGLIDTDGSIFTHRYRVGDRWYNYKKLQFTSRSQPLRQSVFRILQELGLHVRLARDYYVWIDSQNDMKRYFEIVGSHNPKHLKRYEN